MLPSRGTRPDRDRSISPWIMRRHDRHLRITYRDRTHLKQGLLECYGVFTDHLCLEPWASLSLEKPLELPHKVANECVARAAWQRDEDNDRTGCVSWRRNNHDRAVAVQIMRLSETKVRSALESIFLKHGRVQAAGRRGGPTVFVDESALCSRHEHWHARKIGYTADVIPVAMSKQDVAQLLAIVPGRIELVRRRLRLRQIGSQSEQHGCLFQLCL